MTREKIAQWAWVAGILDGEGCIAIDKAKISGHKDYGGLIVTVCMTSQDTVVRLQEITHVGSIRPRKDKRTTRKRTYQWRAYSREAAALLHHCFPFLVTKRPQASLALQYAEIMKFQRHTSPGKPVPSASLARRQCLREAIAQLNQKGT